MARGMIIAALLLPLAAGLAIQGGKVDPSTDLSPSAFEKSLNDKEAWPTPGLASGNPKLQNYNGERFQIHQAGDYNLISVPAVDKDHGNKLTVNALFKRLKEKADTCRLYMKRVVVSGSWLRDKRLVFRAADPSYDFAMRVDTTGKTGDWRLFSNMTGSGEEVIQTDEKSELSIGLRAVIGKRENKQPDITWPVEHRFVLRFGFEDQLSKKAEFEIAQPKPGQLYLNFKAEHLNGLGVPSVNGLLGRDSHAALQPRSACTQSDEETGNYSQLLTKISGGTSMASAHWA